MAKSLIEITIRYLIDVARILRDPELSWTQKILSVPIYTIMFIVNVVVSTAILWILIFVLFLILRLVGI